MREFIVNESSFIYGGFIKSEVCDDVISYFEESPLKQGGECGRGIDPNHKLSTDIYVQPTNSDIVLQNYIKELKNISDLYIKRFPFSLEGMPSWGLKNEFNIQKYQPKEAFYGWHTERCSYFALHRHLVFMTYLNTVTDGGQTEWFHQKLKIQPEKGLTVIWPVDWTYTHRGIASPTQTKYIVTGWFDFFDPNEKFQSLGQI